MIGHKNKFIFIHIPKTGGSSIEHVLLAAEKQEITLCKKSSPAYVLGNTNIKQKHSNHHAELTKSKFKSYFKFSFVRNPWDLEVSYFLFEKFLNKLDKNCTLDEWITNGKECVPFFSGWITPSSCDFIGKFENLHEDFNLVCAQIGISTQSLPHTNKMNRNHYSAYYNKRTQNLVAKKHAKEIEYFNYKFSN